jgi:hypothetical protein
MVKSEDQKHSDSSALGDDSAFDLRCSTIFAIGLQDLMTRADDYE